MRQNNTARYPEFPYISVCGRERNFVRCDDRPFVYTHVTMNGNYLAHNYAADLLTVWFEPNKIFMSPITGRVYHPAPARVGSIGLVRSKLAIEFSKCFRFDNGEHESPTRFEWKNHLYILDSDWYREALKKR